LLKAQKNNFKFNFRVTISCNDTLLPNASIFILVDDTVVYNLTSDTLGFVDLEFDYNHIFLVKFFKENYCQKIIEINTKVSKDFNKDLAMKLDLNLPRLSSITDISKFELPIAKIYYNKKEHLFDFMNFK
jgi:hypothetical protein